MGWVCSLQQNLIDGKCMDMEELQAACRLHGSPTEMTLRSVRPPHGHYSTDVHHKKDLESYRSFDLLSNPGIFKLMERHELCRETVKATVTRLERRSKLLEVSQSRRRAQNQIQDNGSALSVNNECGGHYSCVYVSPTYFEKQGTSHIVEDGHGLYSQTLNNTKGHETDLAIEMLTVELQKRDIEITRLQAELQQCISRDLGDDKHIFSDKFVDKVNTASDRSLAIKAHATNNCNGGSFTGNTDRVYDSKQQRWDEMLVKKCGGNRAGENPDGSNQLCIVLDAMPDLDRAFTTLHFPQSDKSPLQSVANYLATLEASIENVCNSIKMREMRDSDTLKINNGAIEDELFVVKKTLTKLGEICQECGFQPHCTDDKIEPSESSKLEGMQHMIDGLMQQIAQTEFKMIALESSCMNKDKKLEELEAQMQLLVKKVQAVTSEKYELSVTMLEMRKEAEEQNHYIEELLNINEELLDFCQAKEEQYCNVEEAQEQLMQHIIAKQEDKCASLESLLGEREKESEDLSRKLKACQIAADNMIMEKIELSVKIREFKEESEKEKARYKELLNINEELLRFAQAKEDQFAFLNEEVTRLRLQVQTSVEKDNALKLEEASEKIMEL